MSDADDLISIRDWFRHAVTAMSRAKLAYGHGTTNAIDEAAFLILAALDLPITDITPWLDCRLTRQEREAIASLIAARIETRKPAPYLVHKAYIQGYEFYVDERVIVPRSFIGELIVRDRLAAVVPDPDAVSSVLELCTGSGCLAILAAEAFPNAHIVASDVSEDALAVARRNISDYGLGDRIETFRADLYEGLPDARYDLIIANPPYVTAQSVAEFPPEWRAEPALAHLGGDDGLDLVHRIIEGAHDRLEEMGSLVVEIGDGREALEARMPEPMFLWLDTETSEGEVFAISVEDLAAAEERREGRSSG
jgi:ribosomal protein L3 glutamine methyltransferase